MRLIFAGTPEFAATALRALAAAGHEIALVLTRQDKPAGRGQALAASPVKELALQQGYPIAQPRTLRDEQAWPLLRMVGADAMVVAAYGLILPAEVLAIPRLGCLNIHASLLPRWRGAAPIERAIEAGDAVTGVTIMQMDAGMDTGPILLAEELEITAEETGGALRERLAVLGARLIVRALAELEAGTLAATPQPEQGMTYASRILKSELALDWTQPARRLANRVRALDPQPGVTAVLARGAGVALKLWRVRALAPGAPAGAEGEARLVPGDSEAPEPGTVLAAPSGSLRIACGGGTVLEVLELQRAGSRRMAVADFLKGLQIGPGDHLVLPPA
ncbi:MAG: methionyl-tRNA formyltransferase [Burkholderiaceae bacterium]|nr:methionyl-tRNA formyltransferase [Burkholderiaceae bacterium]